MQAASARGRDAEVANLRESRDIHMCKKKAFVPFDAVFCVHGLRHAKTTFWLSTIFRRDFPLHFFLALNSHEIHLARWHWNREFITIRMRKWLRNKKYHGAYQLRSRPLHALPLSSQQHLRKSIHKQDDLEDVKKMKGKKKQKSTGLVAR